MGLSTKGSPCNGIDGFWDYYYALVSAEVDAKGSIMPPPTNSCMTIIPFAQVIEGIIKRDCTFDSLLTVTNLFNFNFLGEIVNGTNDVKIKNGKLVWNNNPNWFSDLRFFQSEVFRGYPASGLGYSPYIFHSAINAPYAEKLNRNYEFRRYFWGPGYCNGGDFNTVLCSNTTQNECILSSTLGFAGSIIPFCNARTPSTSVSLNSYFHP